MGKAVTRLYAWKWDSYEQSVAYLHPGIPGHLPRHQKIFWRGSHAQEPRMNTLFTITVLSTREPLTVANSCSEFLHGK